MKQVVQNYKTGEMSIVNIPTPALKPDGILVQNQYSLISVGTEGVKVRQARMNLIEKAKNRPDQVKKVIKSISNQGVFDTYQKVMDQLDSLTPLGYSCSGYVKEVGKNISHFKVGDRVACAGAGYANHAEYVYIPKNLSVKIPDNVSLQDASFTTAGAIALQGIRQAGAEIGENVAVIGLGLIGLITIKLLNAAGCNTIGIDIEESRVKLARNIGCQLSILREEFVDLRSISTFTNGKGVDSVLITAATSSDDPINLASEISRDRGKIVVVGSINISIPNSIKSDYYDKELEIIMSRSYGPGRYDVNYEEKGRDYPISYVRWTEERNMEAFLGLLSLKSIDVSDLVSKVFKIDEAERAYEIISSSNNQDVIGILFEYDEDTNTSKQIAISKPIPQRENQRKQIGIGLIGVGSHARSKLLPRLTKDKNVRLIGVSSATGLTAKDVGTKHGFVYCSSDYQRLLSDEDIDALFISTRHDLHMPIVIDALKQKKAVFVEKPLAITIEGLSNIQKTYESHPGHIFLGFNRRYSPLSCSLQRFFEGYSGPKVLNYRINAGYQSPDNWYQDPDQGGGRFVGEGGHFIDLMAYIVGNLPIRVYANSAPDQHLPIPDNHNIAIEFLDGSIGTITYTSGGDELLSKERLEVFGGGRVGVLDDFNKLILYKNGRKKVLRSWLGQNKGHSECVDAFISSLNGELNCPVTFSENINTTLTTLLAIESDKQKMPLEIRIENIKEYIK